MANSEITMFNGNETLIVCFGGMASAFLNEPPFEFLRFLSSSFKNRSDFAFYIDKNQCWYHKGVRDITDSVDETRIYLDNIIKNRNYKNVIFMGSSAGGYAAILFGSLCKNVNSVLAFVPQTKLLNPKNLIYSDLKNFINDTTKYILYADSSVNNEADFHHISHCINIECFKNVIIKVKNGINLKELRDNGIIAEELENLIIKY